MRRGRAPLVGVVGLVALAMAGVPLLYRAGWSDVFAAPKLGTIWSVFVVALIALSIAAGLGAWQGATVLEAWRDAPRVTRIVALAVGGWIVWNLVAFAMSDDHRLSTFGEHLWYQGLLTHLLYAGFFILAAVVVIDAVRLWFLAGGVAIGGTAVAVIGIFQQAGYDPVFGIDPIDGRVFSTIGQPNSLAAYLVVTIAAAAAFLGRPQFAWRVGGVIAIAVMATCLAMTESRGGLTGLVTVATVGAAGTVWSGRVRLGRVLAAIAVGATIAAAAYTFVGPVRDRFDRSWARAQSSRDVRSEISASIHLDLWRVALWITDDHPIVGTGQDTYPIEFTRYAGRLPPDRVAELSNFRMESPHNVFLSIASGMGLPALIAYLSLLTACTGAALGQARRTRDTGTRALLVMIAAAVVGHAITDMFMTADLTTAWIVWTLMGGVVGYVARSTPNPPTSTTATSGSRNAAAQSCPSLASPSGMRAGSARPPFSSRG